MSKLLRTNFMRLWKDKVFWISIALMGIAALYNTISLLYSVAKSGGEATLSNVFFDYTTYVLILASVLSASISEPNTAMVRCETRLLWDIAARKFTVLICSCQSRQWLSCV